MKEHNGHSHDTVKKMADKHRNELQRVTAPVEEMVRGLSEVHDNIDKTTKKIRRQGDEVGKKIDQHYDELVQKLMEQKEQLKQQAHDAVSQKEKALRVQQEEVENVQTEVLSMKELKDAIEKSSDQEALSAKKQVIDRMQQITNKYNKLNVHPSQSATMEFISIKGSFLQFGKVFTHVDPGVSEVVNLPNHITVGKELEFSIITKYHNGSECSIGGSQVSVQLESNTGEVTSAQVGDKNDGSYMASFVAEKVGEVKLFVSINGQQIKGSPFMVQSQLAFDYTRVGIPNKIVNNDGNMGQPWGIAFGKNGIWAVVDNFKHCVYIYDDQDQLIYTFGNQKQFKSPTGIAFDDSNHIYVTDRSNKNVTKFNVNGTYLLQVDSQRAKLRDPVGITTHNNTIYIADYLDSCVFVFQSNGNFSHTIGKGQINSPYDVAVSTNNCLLVVGWVDGCIYRFTLDGNYIGSFGQKGSFRGQLYMPSSLTTDVCGYILVAEHSNNRISIFDKTGQFVHSFGSEGCGNGQFKRPYGIALAPNGNIYVSDTLNKRIQIFYV